MFERMQQGLHNKRFPGLRFAYYRENTTGMMKEGGLGDFLVLLSVCETCKCKNVDFLDFLRSGSKDIDDFATRRRGRRAGARG